ncbi:MAG: peroxiredoxin [Rugosibacter sp.]|jgi:thioredoxin-dependent peroxiredoxin|nr:peroxiredoxin [Rugosibacter sp.]MDO9273318.1 peroxiredoxin [Rugosibacter sp.]
MLHAGEAAPDFLLPDADMAWVDSRSVYGQYHAVLFFYPRDNTPNCIIEAADFSDHENEFARLGCKIFGVSRDDCYSHANFRDLHGLSVPLLSDEKGEVCRQFGVSQYREHDGHKKLCIIRSTFIIDKNGIVQHALYDVQPKGHAAMVYQLVQRLNGKGKHHANR